MKDIKSIFDIIDSVNSFDLSNINIDKFTFKPNNNNLLKYKDIINVRNTNTFPTFELDLRKVKFPNDTELFQKSIEKSISNIKLPEYDYSNYNFNRIIMINTIFTENSILPKNKDFFQIISFGDITGSTIPKGDYREYDFDGITIARCKFYEGTKLPLEKDFFKKITNSSLYSCVLPSDDYSEVDFSNVDISEVVFGENSILPKDVNLFNKLKNTENHGIILPKEAKENISFYHINDITFKSLVYSNNLSLETIFIHNETTLKAKT